MKRRYLDNYTEDGYIMKYEKTPRPFNKKWMLQFKIELKRIEPLIWRRIQVPADYNFWDLHVAIQDAMGWSDSHLHYFTIKGKSKRNARDIGIPDFYYIDEDLEVWPGWEIPVVEYFNDLGVEANYLYDYGDYWEHFVQLEGYIYNNRRTKPPFCVGGERACPPEDCGGVDGYYKLLEILSNPKHDEYEEMKIWAGKDWDPEKFDPNEVKFDNPYKRWRNAFLKD